MEQATYSIEKHFPPLPRQVYLFLKKILLDISVKLVPQSVSLLLFHNNKIISKLFIIFACATVILTSLFLVLHTVPTPLDMCFSHFDVQFLEKFGVTFGVEGETLTLRCGLLITPELNRLHPRAEWYRDGKHS